MLYLWDNRLINEVAFDLLELLITLLHQSSDADDSQMDSDRRPVLQVVQVWRDSRNGWIVRIVRPVQTRSGHYNLMDHVRVVGLAVVMMVLLGMALGMALRIDVVVGGLHLGAMLLVHR